LRPNRLLSLLTVVVFACAILAPLPLHAQKLARSASGLAAISAFPVRDDSVSSFEGSGFSGFGGFEAAQETTIGEVLQRDFEKTKREASTLKMKLASFKLAVFGNSKARKRKIAERFRRMREKFEALMVDAIDKVGPRKFLAHVEGISGSPVGAAGGSDQILRASIVRSFSRAFDTVSESMVNGDREVLALAIEDAQGVVESIEAGAAPDEVVGQLSEPQLTEVTVTARRVSPFKTVGRVLNTLFMCGALGLFGFIALGGISYGAFVNMFGLTALGAAGVIACFAGIIYYVAKFIKETKNESVYPQAPVLSIQMEMGVVR